MFWFPIICGGSQATSQARFVWLRFHCTRQDNCVFFCGTGFFSYAISRSACLFLRPAVRPAAETDFTCCHAVSLIFSTDRRRFCKCDVDGRRGRSGALFVCELFFCVSTCISTSQTNACHIVLNVFARACRDEESIHNICFFSSGKRCGSWVVWPRSEAHLVAWREYFVFTTV